ncbi:MAG TPA: hypothetical protein VGO11_07570 [Chthoniobacteraceae bacterium]|jgi:hypothetical protein|nr:hypothetical protein [Chthoniobacteraceae bacterium]
MPYDPTYPAATSPATSAPMRAQLQAIVDLIQSIPEGPQGPIGPIGPAITSYVVDSTNTLNPGENASVIVGFESPTVHFTFNIPHGNAGPEGPPFMNYVVDFTNTLPAGDNAMVVLTFDGSTGHFAFHIPRGDTGAPGEVTTAQLSSAIAGTPSNTNPIATLDLAISDPPTQGEMTQVLAKVNELIVGLRR